MRYSDSDDATERQDPTAKVAGAIVIGCVLALVFIRWTFEKGN